MHSSRTDKLYWESYYKNCSVEKNLIEKICGRYDELYDKWIKTCEKKPQSIIEIGAYPGRYIAYLAAKYSLNATALDYNSDQLKIKEAFAAMSVDTYRIIKADFLEYEEDQTYDLVYSNGFVEHFEDFNMVLDLHSKFLSPGGSMLLLIPNKRYLRKWYGWLFDKKNLDAHNLKSMELNVFKDFGERNNLTLQYLTYDGGFAYRVHQPLNLLQRILYKILRAIAIKVNPFLKKYPSKWYSGSIIAILSNPLK